MYVESRGLIHDATDRPEDERIAFFTSLCPLRSGTVLAGFQVGRAKHAPTSTIRVCRSRDGGETWSELPWRFETVLDGIPGSLATAEFVEAEPGRLLLFATWFDRSDPDRPLFDPVTEGILPSRQLVSESTDEGESWSAWTVLPTPGLTGCATTGPVLRWDDRSIAYAFESFKEHDDPAPPRHGAWLLVSRDGGRSFEPPLLVARDPGSRVYYWDQRLCPTGSDGQFVALFWTHDRGARRDLNVHLLHGSIDQAPAAPDPPQPTTIPGQIAAPARADDSSLLAFAVDRGHPGTMTLWRSRDDGRTWPEADCLVVHQHEERARISQGKEDIDFKQYWEDMGKWSFGHPAIRSLGPGRVLLAFYAGSPARMSIHWARVVL
ncbi:MAG: sialidase family protein [Isosphaeraceae bacterium]